MWGFLTKTFRQLVELIEGIEVIQDFLSWDLPHKWTALGLLVVAAVVLVLAF